VSSAADYTVMPAPQFSVSNEKTVLQAGEKGKCRNGVGFGGCINKEGQSLCLGLPRHDLLHAMREFIWFIRNLVEMTRFMKKSISFNAEKI
jgi:hypothetical protein